MFIGALFVTAAGRKQPRYPSSGKQFNRDNPYQGILLSKKKEPTTDTRNLGESPKNYAE